MNLPLNKYFKGNIKFHSVLLSYIAAFLFIFHLRCLTSAEEERKNCKDLTQVNKKADTRRCQGNIIPLLLLTSSSLDGNHKILNAKLGKYPCRGSICSLGTLLEQLYRQL